MSWQRQLAASLREPQELACRFGLDPARIAPVMARYPVALTPYYAGLITAAADPIGRQCLPDPQELEMAAGLLADPLGEADHMPVPGLIHRYADRVVLLASGQCAVYCRFCTRKSRVGGCAMAACGADLDTAIGWIAHHSAIRDVIVSGGDPLLLDDDRLDDLLDRLQAIPHVEIVRLGTRVPATLPQRITPALVRLLKKYRPLYLNLHFNHPQELTDLAARACDRLADAGLPLGNQTVLLRGVNDNVQTLATLFRGLLRLRVRPYYLHQMDLAQGAAHFRTPLRAGLALMQQLRGPLSGLGVPHFMVDLPGGAGKVPLLPDNLQWLPDGRTALIRAPGGAPILYPDAVG